MKPESHIIENPSNAADLDQLVTNGSHYLRHTASRRGYKSRKGGSHVEPYTGRYGNGFVLVSPRWDTSQYVALTYYIAR